MLFHYSGLNFQDLLVRLGAIDSPPKTPCILGFECSGEVEAIGEGVEDFKVRTKKIIADKLFTHYVWLQVGDRVVALPEYRAWAELVAVSTKFVYKLPENLSFQDAATMLINYLVAYIVLFDLISIRPGKSLLVHSAAGGVVSKQVFLFIFEYLIWDGICLKRETVCYLFEWIVDLAIYLFYIRT